MKAFLDAKPRKGAVRVDVAWKLFFGSESDLVAGPGMPRFAEWLWDELGSSAGNYNKSGVKELRLAIPPLKPDGLDFLARLLSFWADGIYLRGGKKRSKNLWKAPVVNVLDKGPLDGVEKAQSHDLDDSGSKERNLMPTLGPGRAFYSLQKIAKGQSTARFHSHSALDEYYLVLEGKGTLRFQRRRIALRAGDLVGKPAGPDASTHIIADRGQELRLLDMEIWHERAHFPKDLMTDPDFGEVFLRGQGWDAMIPTASLMPTEDSNRHYGEGYRRRKDGGWVPAKLPGHRKVRKKGSR